MRTHSLAAAKWAKPTNHPFYTVLWLKRLAKTIAAAHSTLVVKIMHHRLGVAHFDNTNTAVSCAGMYAKLFFVFYRFEDTGERETHTV